MEVLLNTALVADLIQKGDFSGVREAMEKSLAVGSQSFEQDLARLVLDGLVTRNEALVHADSPNNLLWRLQNDFNASKASQAATPSDDDQSDQATFTEFTLDVKF
jgi:twitching motility protein PilU